MSRGITCYGSRKRRYYSSFFSSNDFEGSSKLRRRLNKTDRTVRGKSNIITIKKEKKKEKQVESLGQCVKCACNRDGPERATARKLE